MTESSYVLDTQMAYLLNDTTVVVGSLIRGTDIRGSSGIVHESTPYYWLNLLGEQLP
jgi:hypothetical protein